MPELIVLRLYPSEPMDPNDFRTLLTGLTIKAFDLSFAKPTDGDSVGSTTGLADPHTGSTTNNNVSIGSGKILQHYIDVDVPNPLPPPLTNKERRLESVATAVIVVTPPAAAPEYPTVTSLDLRLEITRGTLTVISRRLHYNVPLQTPGSLSTSQKVYFGMEPSAFVELPAHGAGLDPSVAFVDLPPDGQPPDFTQLVTAINLVLGGDPGAPLDTLLERAPLTAAESRHVAQEIVWNRAAFPPPTPNPSLGLDPFGALYTEPKVDDTVSDDDIERARPRFEAELDGYYGTREAEALRLAGFVYSAAAAVAEEALSISAQTARLEFPLITNAGTATTLERASVALVETGGLQPAFTVPAAFFYALAAAMPTAVGPDQRFDMARLALEDRLLRDFSTAVDAGVVTFPAAPVTVAGASITAAQAARRLVALGGVQTALAQVPLAAPIETLVTDWLAHAGPTATIDADFWNAEVAAHPGAYLELLLEGVTENHAALITAIKGPPHNVAAVAGLVAISDQRWRDFFLGASPPPGAPPRLGLLPGFTAPGTPEERVEAFIRHLRTFFHVPLQAPASAGPAPGAAPLLPRSASDGFAAFMAAYPTHSGGIPFVFGTPADANAVEASVQDVFPGDADAQAWLRQCLETISALHDLTDIGAGELQFSLMEALYARGFTSGADVTALSPADFQHALEGTVAYPYAMAIFARAGGPQPHPHPQQPFQPVNPDGSLVDCVPPAHLSPLGPVQYLHELLQLSPASTCEDPLRPGDDYRIGTQLTHRRRPLGLLHATAANLQTPVPVIDMVNESLEALTGGGAIYDTAGDAVAGHRLASDGQIGGNPYAHDPQTLFATVPKHSSPATPVAVPAIYDALRADFSHPDLPYPQGLDINRSYLQAMGTSRHSVMRHFRKDITEFAIDANHEPAAFLPHLWRYPLRREIALELLGISPEEYNQLYTVDFAPVPVLYGFASESVGGRTWTDIVRQVPEFLKRSGLDYCEFIELWQAGIVAFGRAGHVRDPEDDDAQHPFPNCEPCCPDNMVIDFGQLDPVVALRKLAVFVRLWRRLMTVRCAKFTMAQLRDVADVLELFHGGSTNPEFVRQLASLVVLREILCLPLANPDANVPDDATGADRTHLLALWEGPTATYWGWAIDQLLDGVEDAAAAQRPDLERDPELDKLRRENLDALSVLAGFDPHVAIDTWHHQPTSTLRFAEVLLKIYVSRFTVGEVLFLFSNAHLDGDDPFALPTPNESLDDPLELPDDEQDFDLWVLRAKLLDAEAQDEQTWTWARITASLETEFGYIPTLPGDPFMAIGEHFFPSILEREGIPVAPDRRRFSVAVPAAGTTPLMWNTPPEGPFRYDTANQQLWSPLPLRDETVTERLSTLDPLNTAERVAVRDLYFAPRALLAPFALLFDNFDAAVHRLVHAADDQERFAYVQAAYARFHRRCQIVAEHLADHVASAAAQPRRVTARDVMRLLRELHGDENAGLTPWEDDNGQPPQIQWPHAPTGGAFAALLGLLGTGLVETFSVAGTDQAWREMRGSTTMFGDAANEWNAPVPTVIPALDLTLTPQQLRLVNVRNGFALRNVDGEPLLGAQPFQVTWSGALLIEEPGAYRFLAGAPTAEGEDPDPGPASDHRWRLRLRRGQREWTLLNRGWPGEEAPDHASAPLELRRGIYRLTVDLEHPQPDFAREEDICPRHTGFQVKYAGPDTNDTAAEIPRRRLFRESVDTPLGADIAVGDAADGFLRDRYTGSLRDIRRTYQRAFKAALLAHRFELSAQPPPGDRQSELGYFLDHAEAFAGRTHPRTGPAAFGTHLAWFAPDLLPVSDPYQPPPPPPADDRENPSPKRQAALFDWWERLYDYAALREETKPARDRPAWRLFYEASERRPDEPVELVRHLGVDIRHAPLVLTYFHKPTDYTIVVPDLETEGWAIRTWRGEVWLDRLERCFLAAWIGDAKPARWAADDPNEGPDAGNENLTQFVRFGAFENGPPRRYEDVRGLNDGLRTRARDALVAYLTSVQRVALPYSPGSFAERPRDLGDLLLQDVETRTCSRASRIDDAISSVHAFVQRARLGLEPSFVPTAAFSDAWDKRFASFHEWRCCAEHTVHRENWIEWEELRRARKVEAFRFLEEELRESKLTVPVPGGLEWWPGRRPPEHAPLTLLQRAEPSRLRLLTPGPLPEGLDLLGTPERDARPSWLAPTSRAIEFEPNGNGDGDGDNGDGNGDNGNGVILHADAPAAVAVEFPQADLDRLPLWIQAAIRLGARFVRVAAAGEPPADSAYEICESYDADGCRMSCGCHHERLVDEYYFWLQDVETYAAVEQNADVGVSLPDETSDWHRPERLPGLLDWPPTPAVELLWSRVHNGEFEPPRRASEPVVVDPSLLPPGKVPELKYMGRTADSLRFEVTGGVAPVGYLDPTPPGFRYDLATDSAVALPLVGAPPAPPDDFPGGLDAYPYFAYVCPGAPVEPVSLFSVAATVAGALRAHCRFESALKWFALEFDPLTADLTWQQCPQDNGDNGNGGNGDGNGDGGNGNNGDSDGNGEPIPVRVHAPDRLAAIAQRRGDLPCCPTAARDDDVARHRALLLSYLETMLDWADALMCRHTPEAFRQADVIVHTMAHMLGDRPLTVLAQDDPQPAETVDAFIPRPAGLNPRLLALYDRTADRLTLLHNCHNCHNGHRRRNGRPVTDMRYFGDDTRVDGWHASDCGCECDECCSTCCDPFRFAVLAQRALELAGDVRSFGAQLLAAYERGDAEHLVSLRAAHERQLLELTLAERKDQWREADWQVQSLRKTKEGAQTRLRYFTNLIANGLIGTEHGYESSIGVSTGSRTAANVSSAIGQAMVYVPDFSLGVAGIAGSPLQFNQLPLGNKLATAFTTAAHILNTVADIANSEAQLSLTRAGWERREQEWRHQVDVITIEIEQIERQILAAERRRDIALRELNNYQRQIDNARQVQDFLRDRFTSHQLYLFLQQNTAALHRQSYELALCVARKAQQAFNREQGHTNRNFLPETPWDSLHEGLLAGERLQVALRHMQQAYADAACREYELTKNISLRLQLPMAFLELVATGRTEIELPEWLFDLDYPGLYMRRIKNVSVSIPAVVGPYSGVQCRLTLLSSRTRVDPRLRPPDAECCHEPCDCSCSDDPCCCCAPDRSGYALRADDSRVVAAYGAREAIATSSGQNDSGLFLLDFRDERYLPFEYEGAVSRWRIELPPETNFFDVADTLADFVIHLSYTAREGGDALRAAAAADARCRLPGDGMRLLDVRRELPDAWTALRAGECRDWQRRFDLRLSSSMFPFVPGRRPRWLERLQILVEAPCADPAANAVVRFVPGVHKHEGPCDCDRIDVRCVASSEFSGLFWGEVDLRGQHPGPLGDQPAPVGTFEFPEALGEICDVYLVAGYCAEPWAACGHGTRCVCRQDPCCCGDRPAR